MYPILVWYLKKWPQTEEVVTATIEGDIGPWLNLDTLFF
jgi:hypothetical protein